ncbi:MAG: hypothetical protein KAH17_01685 [Bacteroidales bacterium]|nr:hypothetical protein [Bacteroidales bacterium]
MFKRISLIFSLVFLMACQDFDPMDGVKIIINYDLFETFVSFRFVDAETGELIGTKDLTQVQAEFGGKHGEAVLTQVGEHPEFISSVFGLVSVAINPFAPHTPSQETPINFSLNASAPGFAESEYSLSISDTGYFTYVIIMPKLAADPSAPTSFKLWLNNLESGVVDKSFEVISPDNSLSLKFPDQMQFINQHGEVTETELLLAVDNYPSFQSTKLKEKHIIRVFDGSNENMMVINPAALTQIELTSKFGDTIRQFKGPEKLLWKFTVPNSFQQHQYLKTWSLNPGTQTWVIGEAAEVQRIDTSYSANLTLNHLCYFVAGEESQTREIEGNLELNYVHEFLSEQFPGEVIVRVNSTNEIIHRIPVSIKEGSVPLSFFAPIEEEVNLQLRALNTNDEFISDPTSVNISKEETRFQSSLNLRPLRCPFAGSITTYLQNDFPYYPILARLRIKDAETNETYKTLNLSLNESQDPHDFWFMLPDNRPISCTIEARTLDNDFIMVTPAVEFSNYCAEEQVLNMQISSTTCVLSGAIQFERLGEGSGSQIRLLVLRESDNRTIHNRTISIPDNSLSYPLKLSVPKNTPIKLVFQAVNTEDGLQFSPDEIIIQNPCASPIDKKVEYTSTLFQFTGSIHFTKDDALNRDPLPIKVAWLDWKTEEIIKQREFDLSFSNPVIEYSEFLEDKPILMRVTRNDPDALFVTDPFILKVPEIKNAPESWDVHLIKTNKQMIHAKLKVICPAGEILPTIQGYYRIPGESWKELFILVGNLVMMAEMYATYEVGMILDGEMIDSTFTVTGTQIEMNFDLDPSDCEKMGWGK